MKQLFRKVILSTGIWMLSMSIYLGLCFFLRASEPWGTMWFFGRRLALPMMMIYISGLLIKYFTGANWSPFQFISGILLTYMVLMLLLGFPYFMYMLFSPLEQNEPVHIMGITVLVMLFDLKLGERYY